MMMMTADLNLMEEVKLTMLQQEIIFKTQVRELHRLYWTQKNLIRELYMREQAKVGLRKEGNVVCLEEVNGKFVEVSENRCRGFNLELLADVYIGNSAKNSIKEKGGSMIPLLDKGKNLYCYEVIDLEEPKEMESHIESPAENCGLMSSSRLHITSDMASPSRVENELHFVPYSLEKKSDFVPDLNLLHDGCSETWEHHKADHSGARGSESSAVSLVDTTNNSNNKQEPNSFKPILIDLNISQDDESSHCFNDPTLTSSFPSSSSSVFQNSQRFKVSNFDAVQESNSTGITECWRKSDEGFSSDSSGKLPNDSERTVISSRDLNIALEENEDEKHQDKINEKSLTGIKSDVLTESNEFSLKILEELSGTTQLDHKAVGSSSEKSWNNEHQHDQDCAIFYAAEILSGIYLASSSSPKKQFDTNDNEEDEPQYASDTFETMTLELLEVSSNEHIMPMIEIEENSIENAKGVIKLKRGRGRIRDFQKEILPGMISLSRHEICEDMHSIGYELRKKTRRANRLKWFRPVRRRRSRC